MRIRSRVRQTEKAKRAHTYLDREMFVRISKRGRALCDKVHNSARGCFHRWGLQTLDRVHGLEFVASNNHISPETEKYNRLQRQRRPNGDEKEYEPEGRASDGGSQKGPIDHSNVQVSNYGTNRWGGGWRRRRGLSDLEMVANKYEPSWQSTDVYEIKITTDREIKDMYLPRHESDPLTNTPTESMSNRLPKTPRTPPETPTCS